MLDPENLRLDELDEDDVLLRIDSICTDEDYFEPPEEEEQPPLQVANSSTALGKIRSAPPQLNLKNNDSKFHLPFEMNNNKANPITLEKIDEEKINQNE